MFSLNEAFASENITNNVNCDCQFASMQFIPYEKLNVFVDVVLLVLYWKGRFLCRQWQILLGRFCCCSCF